MKVIVYTTKNCPRCEILKNWLKNKKVKFQEKNLEDSDVMSELILKDVYSFSSPILQIDSKFLTSDELFEGNKLKNDLLIKFLR
jgi:glutaredoxin